MNLAEIKAAVLAGKTVHWSNPNYIVTHSEAMDSWSIFSKFNRHEIGLTWLDGVTLNGKEEDFYIAE